MIQGLVIEEDSVLLLDAFGMPFTGQMDRRRRSIKVSIRDGQYVEFNYQQQDSTLLLLDTLQLEKVYYPPFRNGTFTPGDLVGLDTDVVFPFQGYEEQRFGIITLRNRDGGLPFQLGRIRSPLHDVALYLPSVVCSGAKPMNIHYDGVVIFIEKGASVKDLVLLEQFLSLHNEIKTFILVTNIEGVGRYKAVIDQRLVLLDDQFVLAEKVEEYTREASPPLPPPPVGGKHTIEDYVSLQRAKLVTIKDLQDLQSKHSALEQEERELVLQLSSSMPIEEYLYLLNWVQASRLTRDSHVKVHILEGE